MTPDAREASAEALAAEDAASRILAQTCFERPFVLEAGAGTGKTTSLVSRIVVWAMGEGWRRAAERLARGDGDAAAQQDRVAARTLQRIVAITFTDAAAAEMARRAGELLSKIATGVPLKALSEGEGIHVAALPQDSAVRQARAKALVGALDRLVVRTIHAFARRLLAAHPVEAQLHPSFEVDGDGRAGALVVRELLELRLRDAYDEPGDPVLLGLAARGVTATALEDELLALLGAATRPELLSAELFSTGCVDALRRALVAGLERLCALAGPGTLGNGRTKVAAELVERAGAACNRLLLPAQGGVPAVEALQAIVRECLEPRLAQIAKWEKADFTASESKALGEEAAVAVTALAGPLRKQIRYLCELDAERLELSRRALAPLLAEATEALRVRGLLSYDALLEGAARLLTENAAVAAHERAQIDQLLVDEFQDTDSLQCASVAALALAGPPAERPGLFLVGDPKQSIYGWRGADLGAYDAFVARVIAAGGIRRSLSVNRRSVQPILDEVERVMRPIMCEEHGLQPRFQPLVSHRSGEHGFSAEPWGPVEYWVSRRLGDGAATATSKPEATALEARALARDVARLVHEQGVAPQEIGVLLRSFGDVEDYLSALRDAGVPFAVSRDRSYYRRREIVDATCLVRCVVDPGDALAFVAFLRSSAVGVPDAALLPLWRESLPSLVARLPERPEQTLAEIRTAVSNAVAALPVEVPGIERVAGWEQGLLFALEALCALRRSFATDPSEVFVERLRGFLLFEVGEAARPLGAFRLANLERFFRGLEESLATGADPSAVLRHLRRSAREALDAEEARPLEAAAQAVQVMSIHKAKGLGFTHTYVMQLHKEAGRRGRAEVPARALCVDGRTELRLLGQCTPGFLAVEARAERLSEAEDVRTLYVAMTRAKDRLVLAGLWPEAGRKLRVAGSHGALLRQRAGGTPALDALVEELRGVSDRALRNGAQWVFPGLCDGGEPQPSPGEGDGHGPTAAARLARAEADARSLGTARRWAFHHALRRYGGPASDLAHEALRERLESRRDGEPVDAARDVEQLLPAGHDTRAVATAVGTAVHRALEVIDLDAEPTQALAQAAAILDVTLAAQLRGDALAGARLRATDVLERFAAGGLFQQLRALSSQIVARELPVLLQPEEPMLLQPEGALPVQPEAPLQGPVGYIAGAIDLVYLDPTSGEPVVVDYKTDAVEGAEATAAHAQRYAAQCAQYRRAVREAFGLPRDPRVELWFLHSGRIQRVP